MPGILASNSYLPQAGGQVKDHFYLLSSALSIYLKIVQVLLECKKF
jgi:hypothetical protein